MDNKKEFLELIELYKKISIDDINRIFESRKHLKFNATEFAGLLTGYGSVSSCKLCRPFFSVLVYEKHQDSGRGNLCTDCVYTKAGYYSCSLGQNAETYAAIRDSENPEQLLKAFKNRAKHMEKVLKIVENKYIFAEESEKEKPEIKAKKENKMLSEFDRIWKVICSNIGIKPELKSSQLKDYECTLARMIFYKIILEKYEVSYKSISDFVHRSHSTISTSIKKINRLSSQADIKRLIENIRKEI